MEQHMMDKSPRAILRKAITAGNAVAPMLIVFW
jgi:hypothetical protein